MAPAAWWASTASAQAAPVGHALLVGNTTYLPAEESIAPARTCVTDLALQLQRFGFQVTTLQETSLDALRDAIGALQKAVAADPTRPALFYFVGHGFQSNSENLLVPANGNLDSKPEDLARASLSLERDVFAKLARPPGPAATVILVDTCRTPDRPLKPPEGLNQTLPPEGCHVAFATGPGKRAFAPKDADRYTLFAEVLVAELAQAVPQGSVFDSLERVRSRVLRKVNAIDIIVKLFGRDAQAPELASNVVGDPIWIGGAPVPPMPARTPVPTDAAASGTEASAVAAASAPAAIAADAVQAELTAIAALSSPEQAQQRLQSLAGRLPEGDLADLVQLRLRDLPRVVGAARTARLNPDLTVLQGQPPKVIEDARRALRGDKYAAMRVAQALPQPAAGQLIERTDHGRWMSYSAYLGNGIAAWNLSQHFRNVDRRDAEAARYGKLARDNHYIPPRQLGGDR
ncbi:MAG: caspase family protein [Rubrivivax sp.]